MKKSPISLICFSLLVAGCQYLMPAGADEANAPRPEIIRVNEKRTNLLLFNTGGEALYANIGGCADLFALGSLGTTLSCDGSKLVLHTGRLVVDTDKSPLSLSTRLCSLTIAPQTSAIIEVHPHRPVRIMAVGGTRADAIVVKTRGKHGEMLSLKPGEELLLIDTVLPPEEMVPPDGVARLQLAVNNSVRGLDIRKNSFAPDEFAQKEVTRQESAYKLSGDKQGGFNRLIEHMTEPAKSVNAKFAIPQSKAQSSDMVSHGTDPLHVLAAGGSEFTFGENGILKLRTGSLFLHVPREAAVDTAIGTAYGDKDAILVVGADPGVMRVAACSGPGDVWVVINNQKTQINPGVEILATDHSPTDEDKLPPDGVGRRDFQTKKVGETYITYGDFSIVSMLYSFDHLKPIRQPSLPVEHHILDKLERAAAAVTTVTAAKGSYRATPKKSRPGTPSTPPTPAPSHPATRPV